MNLKFILFPSLFGICLLSFCNQKPTFFIERQWKNGIASEKYEYIAEEVNNTNVFIKHGKYFAYYPNKSRWIEASYNHGILDTGFSAWDSLGKKCYKTSSYEDGDFIIKCFYLDKNGNEICHGPYLIYDADLKEQVFFKNGKREGEYIDWKPRYHRSVYGARTAGITHEKGYFYNDEVIDTVIRFGVGEIKITEPMTEIPKQPVIILEMLILEGGNIHKFYLFKNDICNGKPSLINFVDNVEQEPVCISDSSIGSIK